MILQFCVWLNLSNTNTNSDTVYVLPHRGKAQQYNYVTTSNAYNPGNVISLYSPRSTRDTKYFFSCYTSGKELDGKKEQAGTSEEYIAWKLIEKTYI